MSIGGVFQIISNDGKADKMIMANDLLEQRISTIRDFNRSKIIAAGGDPSKEDLDPTLDEIAQTHIIHFQVKFQPFVALGIEYQKLIPQSGGAQFGQQVSFSLTQFGDFFSDMALNLVVSQASALPAAVPALPATVTPPTLTTNQTNRTLTLPDGTQIDSISPTEQMVRGFQYLGYFDHTGKKYNTGELYADNVVYCDFVGERIPRLVSFEINGNPMDDFDSYSYVFFRNFKLQPHKRMGYYRCVGQELPKDGRSQPIGDGIRYGGTIYNGLQTPKQVQPEFQIWQRMLFWFSLEQSQALPSAAIPYGQRYINVHLEDVNKLLYRSAALFLIVKVTSQYYPGLKFTTTNTAGVYDLTQDDDDVAPRNTFYNHYQLPTTTNGELVNPTIKQINLYVNNIFTHPMVHALYIKRIGFSLVRIHRRQKQPINQQDYNLLMNQFKFPTEYIYCGLLPDENTTHPVHSCTDWHQFSKIVHKHTKGGISLNSGADIIFDASKLTWQEKVRTIDQIEVMAHGMQLYQKIDMQFYNQYLPQIFGQHTMVTPEDQGLAFINFSLFPGVYQPSGHINISRAREFYIHVYSSVIGADNGTGGAYSGKLICEASALNFLLISDGSAVLRYST